MLLAESLVNLGAVASNKPSCRLSLHPATDADDADDADDAATDGVVLLLLLLIFQLFLMLFLVLFLLLVILLVFFFLLSKATVLWVTNYTIQEQ